MRATSARSIFLLVFLLAVAACGGGENRPGGGALNGLGIARLNTDGTLDAGFAFGTGFDSVVFSVAPANDGSGDVYVGGFFASYNGAGANRIARLNADGTLDTGFAIGTGFDSTVNTIAPASDGSGNVYVGGRFLNYNGASAQGIARLKADGTLDAGFANSTGFNNGVTSIAPANDGSGNVYVGKGDSGIVRLKSDGTPDAGFAVGTGFGGLSFGVSTVAPANDGSGDVYVGGDFSTYNGAAVMGIARLNADGTLDTGFDVGVGFGVFGTLGGFSSDAVSSIAPANDGSGDVYVGGNFSAYKGAAAMGVARLDANGTLNVAFAMNTGLIGDGFVSTGSGFIGTGLLATGSIAAANDGSGKVFAGGRFFSPRTLRPPP